MKILKYFLLASMILISFRCTREADKEFKLYTLDIEYSGIIQNDDKIPMTLHVSDQESQKSFEGSIEYRGGFSLNFPKKSFEVDLVNDVSLAGLPHDDDWVLNANYIDKTFLRHAISYEIFREMDSDNHAPKTEFVEIALNGVYNGLYVLMEKLDRSVLGVLKSDDEAFIFKEPHIFRTSYDGVVPQDPDNFHQQTFPDIEDKDMRAEIEAIREVVLFSEEEEFREMIDNTFDIDNLIDWNILLLVSNNSDGILKNFYFYKSDKKSPVRIAPWDYDHSFGRDGDNELNLDRYADLNRSVMFNRLLQYDWYLKKLKERWALHKSSSIMNKDALKERILLYEEEISPLVSKNFLLWPIDASFYFDDNDFGEEIQIMLQFIDIRHPELDEYFTNL